MHNRRKFLGMTTALSAAAFLTACGQTPAQIAATAVSDAQLIASAFSKELPVIGALTGVPASTLSKISADFAGAIAVSQSISADMSTAQAGPLVQQIENYVGDALTLATSAPLNALLPPGVLPILEAADALLPALTAAVGMLGAPVNPTMTPDAARAKLQAFVSA